MRAPPSVVLAALLASACGSVTSIGDGGGQGGSAGRRGGTGGQGGSLGTGGGGATSCMQLESDYAAELARAKSCSPGAAGQCQQTAPNALACPCQTFVI